MVITIGQAAFDQAQAFKQRVVVGAVIVAKMDDHSEGGGARSVCKKPSLAHICSQIKSVDFSIGDIIVVLFFLLSGNGRLLDAGTKHYQIFMPMAGAATL